MAQLRDLITDAMRHHAERDFAQAMLAYRAILEIAPSWAEAHNNLGAVLQDQHLWEQAKGCYRQAITLKPGYAEAHHNLGVILELTDQLDDAATQYRRTIELSPDHADAWSNLGNIQRKRGLLVDAMACHRRALSIRPDHAKALNNAGCVLKDLNQLEESVRHFQMAVSILPSFGEAYRNLGCVLHAMGRFAEAIEALNQAVALAPDDADSHYNLGVVLSATGEADLAQRHYELACTANPGHAMAHNNLANLLTNSGAFELARAEYDCAIALEPYLAEAHLGRAGLGKFTSDDPGLAQLKVLAKDINRLPLVKRPFIHFALAKALDDIGDYPGAIEQWITGNQLKRQLTEYDQATTLETFRKIAGVFDTSLMEHLAGLGDPSPVPIFIVGMPRSGTTLVEQMISNHPQVLGGGELTVLRDAVDRFRDSNGQPMPYPDFARGIDVQGLRRLAQSYLSKLPLRSPEQLRVTDKLPGNFIYLGLIHLILPAARIIHVQRDPIDTCFSCFSRLFTAGVPFSYDLGELGRYFRGYQELMAHWRRVLPAESFLEMRYELLVGNPEAECRKLIDFCELEWDPQCLAFHQNKRPVSTASSVQVRGPLSRESIGRWRRYEPHLQKLLEQLS
jgi:tetratricopeptide (TPR) repeat protein